jgi:NADH-quinone oxidoreductase subunit F
MRVLPAAPISIDEYLEAGGGRALVRARELGPDATIDIVHASGLRGRGGGGFPTGRKWRTVRDEPGTHHYVVVNAAEGEPGTFKDRELLRRNPYQMIEGMAIAAFVVGAREAFIGLKARFRRECERVRDALEEMATAGLLEDLTVSIARGPDEYLFGEEKALLEVIEGNDPLPRVLPPFQHGLFATRPQLGWAATPGEPGHRHSHEANPTLVNNVETLSHVPGIVAQGADWFRGVGTQQSPGTTVFTFCGDLAVEGIVELPLGTTLRTLLDEHGQGTRSGRPVKMVCSGVANPVLSGERLDTPMDYESLRAVGGGLGSAGFVFYDDDVCALAVARLFSRFLYVESCGQCPPCKLGAGAITEALEAIERRGDSDALTTIQRWLPTVTDANRCYLGTEEQQVVSSVLRQFAEDVVAHEEGRCRLRHDLVIPKLTDLVDGHFLLDELQMRKLPDWTYATVPV